MHIRLDQICSDDLEFIRGLRNLHRRWFFDSSKITLLDQEDWYNDYFSSTLIMWVINYKGQDVGTLSRKPLAYRKSSLGLCEVICVYEIGHLMLLPDFQGKGIMLEALRQVTALSPRSFYVAHVKSTNTASLRLFEKAGFWKVPHSRRSYGN